MVKSRSPVEMAQLKHVCGYCSAPAGQWCQFGRRWRESGRVVPYLHASRYWQAVDAGELPIVTEE